jgi:hypothetical protein
MYVDDGLISYCLFDRFECLIARLHAAVLTPDCPLPELLLESIHQPERLPKNEGKVRQWVPARVARRGKRYKANAEAVQMIEQFRDQREGSSQENGTI